jgi:uncharacterized protein YidB (DUF937 family)
MGLLDDVLGQVLKPQGAGDSTATVTPGGDQLTKMLGSFLGADKKDASPIIVAIMKFIQSQGGISGIIAKFQKKGFDKQADSWVGTGQNEKITPQQVEQVFDQPAIDDLAKAMNTTPHEASKTLADYLPELLNQFTPDGKLPANEGDVLTSVMGMLGGKNG